MAHVGAAETSTQRGAERFPARQKKAAHRAAFMVERGRYFAW